MKRLLQRLFPRSAKYDLRWALENSLGENVLYNTESLCKALDLRPGMRVLDLGCGKAASSIFIAREYGCKVWAVDNSVSAEANAKRVRCAFLEGEVIPVNADATALPFEPEFFDRIVAVDSYLYYGANEEYLPYVLRFLKPSGLIAMIDAGVRQEWDEVRTLSGRFRRMAAKYFRKLHSVAWWQDLWKRSGRVRIVRAEEAPEAQAILRAYIEHHPPEERHIVQAITSEARGLITIIRLIARKLQSGRT